MAYFKNKYFVCLLILIIPLILGILSGITGLDEFGQILALWVWLFPLYTIIYLIFKQKWLLSIPIIILFMILCYLFYLNQKIPGTNDDLVSDIVLGLIFTNLFCIVLNLRMLFKKNKSKV